MTDQPGSSDPRYRLCFREADLESGQAIVREGFRVVLVSSLAPSVHVALLSECLPLHHVEVLCLKYE